MATASLRLMPPRQGPRNLLALAGSNREDMQVSTGADRLWPTDKLTALRTGQRLVAEVPASRPGRRAFVDFTPVTTPADAQARLEGWKRTDYARSFRLQHWDYDADLIDGWDYDLGAVMIRAADVTGEGELLATLQAWQLRPEQFLYPWQTDDPK